jgi:hypothetical protein
MKFSKIKALASAVDLSLTSDLSALSPRDQLIGRGKEIFVKTSLQSKAAQGKLLTKTGMYSLFEDLSTKESRELQKAAVKWKHQVVALLAVTHFSDRLAPQHNTFKKLCDDEARILELEKDAQITCNATFQEQFLQIVTSAIQPTMLANGMDGISAIAEPVDLGITTTRQFDIENNDTAVFSDHSNGTKGNWQQEFYSGKITLDAKPYIAKIKLNWYDMIASEDSNIIATFLSRFDGGFQSLLYNLAWQAFWKIIDNTDGYNNGSMYLPWYLNPDVPMNRENLAKIKTYLTALGYNRMAIYGYEEDLIAVEPTVGTQLVVSDSIADRLIGIGYLGEYGGCQIIPLNRQYLPNTYNTSGAFSNNRMEGKLLIVPYDGHRAVATGVSTEGQFAPTTTRETADQNSRSELVVSLTVYAGSIPLGVGMFGILNTPTG